MFFPFFLYFLRLQLCYAALKKLSDEQKLVNSRLNVKNLLYVRKHP